MVIRKGKNINFKCSHTLSLIGLKVPTNILLLDQSNVKCRITPSIIIKIVLTISDMKIILFFNIYITSCRYICLKSKIYYYFLLIHPLNIPLLMFKFPYPLPIFLLDFFSPWQSLPPDISKLLSLQYFSKIFISSPEKLE